MTTTALDQTLASEADLQLKITNSRKSHQCLLERSRELKVRFLKSISNASAQTVKPNEENTQPSPSESNEITQQLSSEKDKNTHVISTEHRQELSEKDKSTQVISTEQNENNIQHDEFNEEIEDLVTAANINLKTLNGCRRSQYRTFELKQRCEKMFGLPTDNAAQEESQLELQVDEFILDKNCADITREEEMEISKNIEVETEKENENSSLNDADSNTVINEDSSEPTQKSDQIEDVNEESPLKEDNTNHSNNQENSVPEEKIDESEATSETPMLNPDSNEFGNDYQEPCESTQKNYEKVTGESTLNGNDGVPSNDETNLVFIQSNDEVGEKGSEESLQNENSDSCHSNDKQNTLINDETIQANQELSMNEDIQEISESPEKNKEDENGSDELATNEEPTNIEITPEKSDLKEEISNHTVQENVRSDNKKRSAEESRNELPKRQRV